MKRLMDIVLSALALQLLLLVAGRPQALATQWAAAIAGASAAFAAAWLASADLRSALAR